MRCPDCRQPLVESNDVRPPPGSAPSHFIMQSWRCACPWVTWIRMKHQNNETPCPTHHVDDWAERKD